MPEEPLKPVGKLTPVETSEVKPASPKPVGRLTPVGEVEIPMPKEYGIKDIKSDDQLENTLNDIVKTSKGKVLDSEKDILRDILKNPNTTPDQAKEAIQTIQGYHPKFTGDRTSYYLKKDDNGVLVPKPLASGERPPKGYDVASVWGNPKQANDDSWYTDMGKSLTNGVLGAVKGLYEVGNLIQTGVTGKESEFFNNSINTFEGLQFKKDESLDKPLYNTEGIKQWSDLLDKNRFDISPETLWGTLNMTAESVAEFFTGAGAAAKGIKAVTGAEKLGKAGLSTAAFTGSFLTQVGDNIENAKEAGLQGRDISAFATAVTSAQAAIDAQFGIAPNIFKNVWGKTEKEVIKQFVKEAEKDASGQLTKEGFKQVVEGTTLAYQNTLAQAIKQGVVSAGKEGLQEVGQDFVAKAGEQLYDKLSDEDKAKFGTNATSAESFGSYMQNFAAGLVGGVLMSPGSVNAKEKYKNESVDALNIVEGGKDKIDEFKANVYAAQRRGDLTETERDRAIFKIDQYDKYNEQVKGLPNMSKQDKREAFELSFNIEGLKSEIPEDMEGLDPIAIAKVKNKEELIKGLQKDLNHILLKQDIQTETIVPDKVKDDVAKEVMPEEPTEGKKKTPSLDELIEKIGGITPTAPEGGKIKLDNIKARRPIAEVPLDEWNDNNRTSSLERKKMLQEHLKTTPENEIEATLQEGENGTIIAVLPDGKKINLAQSAKSIDGKTQENIKRENLPSTVEYGKVVDAGGMPAMSSEMNEQGEPKPLFSYKEPVAIKRVEIASYDKKGERVKKDGKPVKKAVLSVYNKDTGGHIVYVRELDKGQFRYQSSEYSPLEQEQLKEIRDLNHLTDEIAPYKSLGKPSKAEVVKEEEKPVEVEQKIKLPKPKLSLNFIRDNPVLKSKYSKEKRKTKSGDIVEINVSVGKKQAEIESDFKKLEKLIDCIYGS